MSSHSYDSTCPCCGVNDMNSNQESRPFLTINHECLECGFYTTTEKHRLTLDKLNTEREEQGLEPLNALPKIEAIGLNLD